MTDKFIPSLVLYFRGQPQESPRTAAELRSDLSRETHGSRGLHSKEPYPSTYPGNRTQIERDLSDPSKPRLGSYSERPGYSSPGRRLSAENQASPDRRLRAGHEPGRVVRHYSDASKHSASEKRRDRTSGDPVALEHRPRSLKPPDSPLIQHAPRRAQPFLGRKTGESLSDSTGGGSKAKDALLPPPVPPWKSKTEEPPVEKPVSPVWEKQSAKTGIAQSSSFSPSSPRVLNPVGSPPLQHTKIPGPLSPGATKKSPIDPDLSPSREERIAMYKEQRRKELASLYGSGGKAEPGAESASYMKYSKKLSPESSKEEKKVGTDRIQVGPSRVTVVSTLSSAIVTSPLVATVAPMATTAITSPIASRSMVSSPSKVSSLGTSSVMSSPSPTSKVTPTGRVTSPTSLKSSVPQSHSQDMALKSPTKQTLPPSKIAPPKVMSPQLSRQLPSPSQKPTWPEWSSPKLERSPVVPMSPPQVASPQTARSMFFSNLSPTTETIPKASPSLIPKMAKPLSQPVTQVVTSVAPVATKAAEATAAVTQEKPAKAAPQSLTPSEKSAFSPVKPKSPSKLFGKSPTKSKSSKSPFSALGALAGPLSAFASGGIAMATRHTDKVAKTTASQSAAVTTVTSSVISPVMTAVTSVTKSELMSPESVLLDDLVKSGRSKLGPVAPDQEQSVHRPTEPRDIKDTKKLLESKIPSPKMESPKPVRIGDTETKLHIEEPGIGGEPKGRRSLYIEEPTDVTPKVEPSPTEPKPHVPVFAQTKPLSEPKTEPKAVASKTEPKVEPKLEPAPVNKTGPPKQKRPLDLHIEKPVFPTYHYKVVEEPKETEVNVKEIISVKVEEVLPDTTEMVYDKSEIKAPSKFEVPTDEVKRLEEKRTHTSDIRAEVGQVIEPVPAGSSRIEPVTTSNTELATELSIPQPAEEEMRALEEEIKQMEQRLLNPQPTTPTSPVSHSDLYEQAIALKKRELSQREERAAATEELAVAMKRMGDKKREAARQMAKQAVPVAHQPPEAVQSGVRVKTVSLAEDASSPVREHFQSKTSSASSSVSQTPTTPSTPLSPTREQEGNFVEKGLDRCAIEDEERRKRMSLFTREDSFNRADSPIREPIPLPKDSVIARHRQSRSRHRVRQDSSSSTDSPHSPVRSPRASPRSPRKPKAKHAIGSKDSTRLGVDYVPQEVDRGR